MIYKVMGISAYILRICILSGVSIFFPACTHKEKQLSENEKNFNKKLIVIPGKNEIIDSLLIQKGQVLISYSDCSECHKEKSRAKGPAFSDIAKKYPQNQEYIDILAGKVIGGGYGVWGNPVMPPHPKLGLEDAKAMVAYILSYPDTKTN